MENKIAIIGAGISGLIACKYALSRGFSPVVFEARSSVGGVWRKTMTTTKLQTPKPFYQFSDFPWPSSVTDDFPNTSQVFEYIQAYANHFDLLRHIRFCRKVLSLEYQGPTDEEMEAWSHWGGTGEPFSSKGKWIITVLDTENQTAEVHEANFVILCIGKYSDVPNIPEFPPGKGPEKFQGKVIHSMEYSNMKPEVAAEFVKGKRVAVVGLQKSALDIVMECSDVKPNGGERKPSCTVLYRTKYWNVPDYVPWGISIGYLYLNRFSELLVHKPGEGFLLSLLASFLSPVRWGFSKFVESHIKHKHRLEKFDMVPDHSFLNEISACTTSTVPQGFYDRVENGSIQLKKAPKFDFCKEGILVVGEAEPVKADLVILATGYKGIDKLKHIFSSTKFQNAIAESEDTRVPLYRECIPPRIPQLAVLGLSESITNLFTSEMRCRWLMELLDGKFKLPSYKEMEKDIEEWDKYMKRYSGKYYRKSSIGALHIWYNDQLCRDMGWNPKRKKGFVAELFQPYGPLDYVNP